MSPRPIRFLEKPYLLALHRTMIADQGGDPTIRDEGLLDSALAMPAQQVDGVYLHPDLPSMAAASAFHLCRNHPFVDGNKRAAFGGMIALLADNGLEFEVGDDEAERMIVALAAGEIDKVALTEWVRRLARPEVGGER